MFTEYVFKKVDGSIRTLISAPLDWAEKNQSKAWEKQKPKGIRKASDKVITVWDVKAKGFRSIKPETIIGKRVFSERKRPMPIKVIDSDFYHKRYNKPFMKLRRGQTPYYIMTALFYQDHTTQTIHKTIEFVMEAKGRKMEKRAGRIRSVDRVIKSFISKGFIDFNGETLSLSNKGRLFVGCNV